jgi:hypothetical protein
MPAKKAKKSAKTKKASKTTKAKKVVKAKKAAKVTRAKKAKKAVKAKKAKKATKVTKAKKSAKTKKASKTTKAKKTKKVVKAKKAAKGKKTKKAAKVTKVKKSTKATKAKKSAGAVKKSSSGVPATRTRRPAKEVSSHTLDTEEKNELPEQKFAFPDERKEPLVDAAHVRNAIARFDQVSDVSDEERDLAWARIKEAAKEFDVQISESDWRDLIKEATKSD